MRPPRSNRKNLLADDSDHAAALARARAVEVREVDIAGGAHTQMAVDDVEDLAGAEDGRAQMRIAVPEVLGTVGQIVGGVGPAGDGIRTV